MRCILETGVQGIHPSSSIKRVQMLLTIALLRRRIRPHRPSLATLSAEHPLPVNPHQQSPGSSSAILLAPFAIAYILLLFPGATQRHHRSLSARRCLSSLCSASVRYYQERIQPQLPLAQHSLWSPIMAIYGVTVTHNTFALYRARVALAAELRADGIPDTSVDNGWEYNLGVELQHANHINDPRIIVPAHAYVPTPRSPAAPAQCPGTTTPPTSIPSTASPSTPTPATAPRPSLPSTTPAGSPLHTRHPLRRPLHPTRKTLTLARPASHPCYPW